MNRTVVGIRCKDGVVLVWYWNRWLYNVSTLIPVQYLLQRNFVLKGFRAGFKGLYSMDLWILSKLITQLLAFVLPSSRVQSFFPSLVKIFRTGLSGSWLWKLENKFWLLRLTFWLHIAGCWEANFIKNVAGGFQSQNSCCSPTCWHGKMLTILWAAWTLQQPAL